MMANFTTTGIILIAGNSTRYNKKINKNFEKIDNRYVLTYSLNVFNQSNRIDDIILVIRLEDIEMLKIILRDFKFKKPLKLVMGGRTRQESVYNALQVSNADFVLIHDGARPLIKKEFIDNLLDQMNDYKGATIAVKAKDTVKIGNENDEVIATTNRNNTWIVQTPQCFDRKILLRCHETTPDNLSTDDCTLLERENYKVKLVNGDYSNIKLTTKEDINIIKEYVKTLHK